MNIIAHPAWAAALAGTNWVSIASTGDPSAPNFEEVPNGTMVSFFQQFTIDTAADVASLSVLADDTTSVVVNGHMVAAPYTISGNACAAKPIGCLISTRGDFGSAALVPWLQVGTNRIQFDVLQQDLVAFGLDYSATIHTLDPVTSPEPASVWLVAGAGLLLGITRKMRRQRTGPPSI